MNYTYSCWYLNLCINWLLQASQATTTGVSQATEYDATSIVLPPPGANFFVIKSSFELESPNNIGSYFINVLCKYIMNIGHETSLFDVITAVLGELKANRNELPQERRNNILPEVTSTLLIPFHMNGSTPLNFPCYEDKDWIGKLVVFNYTYNSDKSVNASKCYFYFAFIYFF